jgi:thiamine-phosphate pyrophosphorylase
LAEKKGADYLGVSPIFPTATKRDAGKPIGLNSLKEIRKKVKLPLVALGGINLKNAGEVISAGADGICAISAVVARKDVCAQIRKFQKVFC